MVPLIGNGAAFPIEIDSENAFPVRIVLPNRKRRSGSRLAKGNNPVRIVRLAYD